MMKRIICAFVWAALALVAVSSRDGLAQTTPTYSSCSYGKTPQDLCRLGIGPGSNPTYVRADGNIHYYNCSKTDGTQPNYSNSPLGYNWTCSSPSCPTGYALGPNGTCVSTAPTCTAGQAGVGDWKVGSSRSPTAEDIDAGTRPFDGFPGSDGSCDIVVDEVVKCYATPNATGGQDFFCTYGYKKTGNASPQGKPAPQTPPTTPKKPADMPPSKDPTPNDGCPKGTVNMGTDSSGIPICGGEGTKPAPDPTPPKTEKTANTTNPDGSTTKTTTTTQTNGDGSTTTKTVTETTGADGSKTTNVTESTGKASDGSDGKKDGSPDDKKNDLCKQNPQLNICRNSSISGSCENVSCEGDAIQCAIARQQAKEACERKKDQDDTKATAYHKAGQDALDQVGVDKLPNPNTVTPTDVGNLSASGWLGGGSCLKDISVTTKAGSFVIPLSKACDVLVMFRYLFMFVASMIAFRILSRAFLGD